MSEASTEMIDVSARLTRETGILAGRLAQFLATSLPRIEGSITEGQQFLQAFFESVSDGRPLVSWSRNPLDRSSPGSSHPIDRLARVLALSASEIELLVLGGLSEEHEGLAAILRSLHPRNEPRATLGLAAQLLGDGQPSRSAFRALIESSALVRSGALQVADDGPFFERSLQPAEGLWSALHGIDIWPAAVVNLGGPISTAGLDDWFETTGAKRVIAAIQQNATCTVLINADSEETSFSRARALVAGAGAEGIGILLPASRDAGLEKLIQVHALARGVIPIIRLAASDGPGVSELPSFAGFPGVIVACGRSTAACTVDGRRLIAVRVDRLMPLARQRMWREAIPALAPQAAFLASHYPVESSMASAIAADLKFVGELENREPKVEDVATSIRARGRISSSTGARLIHPRASWQDLVLPADRLEQLHEAVSRLELQGQVFDEWGFLRGRTGARGVRLLFTGPPGTGKTLSAEVLASALNVDLLIVDLSRVVSKWIGETEKNLASVFDAAERGQAALFFDEADALFGKRTEVTDAHDRYANLETAYLLTRLEQFEGLTILATNLRDNIDAAFLRRLEFVIDFEEPDRAERLARRLADQVSPRRRACRGPFEDRDGQLHQTELRGRGPGQGPDQPGRRENQRGGGGEPHPESPGRAQRGLRALSGPGARRADVRLPRIAGRADRDDGRTRSVPS